MAVQVDAEKLKKFCEKILKKNQIPFNEAEVIADSLVDANLIGVDSHGVTRLADYLKRLDKGIIERSTKLEIIRENDTTALYDANNGWGQYASKIAVETGIKKAKLHGNATIAVKNSNHFGTSSYFTKMAAESDCIGIAMTNASPLMVSWGSKEPTLGTNPLSIAVPTNRHPVVLDMATSNVARGKINLAAKNNEDIPKGWAITKDGNETTDAVEALKGYLLPLGPKGSGLAMMIDILSGVLTGSLFGKDVPKMYDDSEPQQLGHMFIIVNISDFLDISLFKKNMDERIQQTISSTPANNFDSVYMPGDIEHNNKLNHLNNGVKLSTSIYEELSILGNTFGVNIESIKV